MSDTTLNTPEAAADILAETLAPELDQPEGFVIDNLSKATWALRKIARHRQSLAEHEAVADEEYARIEAWLAPFLEAAEAERQRIARTVVAARQRCQDRTGHLVELLAEFHRRRLTEANDGAMAPEHMTAEQWRKLRDGKSIATPAGVLKAKRGQDTVEVDAEVFVPWAEAHADALLNPPAKRTPSKAAIKQLVPLLTVMADGTLANADTGEFLPGVTLVDGQVTYAVELEEGQL